MAHRWRTDGARNRYVNSGLTRARCLDRAPSVVYRTAVTGQRRRREKSYRAHGDNRREREREASPIKAKVLPLDNHAFLKTPGTRCAELIAAPRSIEFRESWESWMRSFAVTCTLRSFPLRSADARVLRNFSGISLGDPKQYPARGIARLKTLTIGVCCRDRVGVPRTTIKERTKVPEQARERSICCASTSNIYIIARLQPRGVQWLFTTPRVAFYGRAATARHCERGGENARGVLTRCVGRFSLVGQTQRMQMKPSARYCRRRHYSSERHYSRAWRDGAREREREREGSLRAIT